MYRTHTCGQLNAAFIGQNVTLSGWVQRTRDLGGMTFVDLRDRYGITQLAFNDQWDENLLAQARKLGREYVVQIEGVVIERSSKNRNLPTGEIEIEVKKLTVLNSAKTPPFTIEDETDGGEDLRMKYRYLDLRRNPVKENLLLRHRVNLAVRQYLSKEGFVDVETPFLIKSTPEGARDFVVPSRVHEGEFYALPQSPQSFKQLLMVAGMDKYFQIVKCFRDEDLRADRQPEFTQIDCEMAFVEQEDILKTFEGLLRFLLKEVRGVEVGEIPRMTYHEAMERYGNDKPDIRFGMELNVMNDLVQNKGFKVFDDAQYIGAICAPGCAEYSRKQLDALTDWVKRPQIGMQGLIYSKVNADGSFKSSVDKFFDEAAQKQWAEKCGAQPGDLILILAGNKPKTQKALSELRLHMAKKVFSDWFSIVRFSDKTAYSSENRIYSIRLDSKYIETMSSLIEKCQQLDKLNRFDIIKLEEGNISKVVDNQIIDVHSQKVQDFFLKTSTGTPRKRKHYFILSTAPFTDVEKLRDELTKEFHPYFRDNYKPLWVLDFPLLEWDEEAQRYFAMHHPFTSPKPEDISLIDSDPGKVRANAYDLVLNGNEIGGGSIRIHNRELQQKMFDILGFTPEEAQKQFGFLMQAFEYGAPPHGGIAFGFDRLVALLGGQEVIRDYIAFPKNNAGRDVMIDAPATISTEQLDELHLSIK